MSIGDIEVEGEAPESIGCFTVECRLACESDSGRMRRAGRGGSGILEPILVPRVLHGQATKRFV